MSKFLFHALFLKAAVAKTSAMADVASLIREMEEKVRESCSFNWPANELFNAASELSRA